MIFQVIAKNFKGNSGKLFKTEETLILIWTYLTEPFEEMVLKWILSKISDIWVCLKRHHLNLFELMESKGTNLSYAIWTELNPKKLKGTKRNPKELKAIQVKSGTMILSCFWKGLFAWRLENVAGGKTSLYSNRRITRKIKYLQNSIAK